MTTTSPTVVGACVQGYVTKGVLKRLKHVARDEGERFEFDWLSQLGPMVLEADYETATLTFVRFLPKAPADVLETARAYVAALRPDGAAPDHRKIDPDVAEASLDVDAAGDAHLTMRLHAPEAEYATRRLVNLASELFHHLQMKDAHYMYEAFGGSTE